MLTLVMTLARHGSHLPNGWFWEVAKCVVVVGGALVVRRAVEVVVVSVVAACGRDGTVAMGVLFFLAGFTVVESVPKGGQVSFCS